MLKIITNQDYFNFEKIIYECSKQSESLSIFEILMKMNEYQSMLISLNREMEVEDTPKTVGRAYYNTLLTLGVHKGYKDLAWSKVLSYLSEYNTTDTIKWTELEDLFIKASKYQDLIGLFDDTVHEFKNNNIILLQLEEFINEIKSMRNTSFDYIESIYKDNDLNLYAINLFIEPCGNIAFYGNSITEIVTGIHTIFKTQPSDFTYIQSGWYIAEYLSEEVEGQLISRTLEPMIINKNVNVENFWKKERKFLK